MKTFVLLENIYFVCRSTPTRTLVQPGLHIIRIDAKLCSIVRSAFTPCIPKTLSMQQSQNHICYERFKTAVQGKLQACTYFNFTFAIMENYSCQQQKIEYQFRMEMWESMSRKDWLKILKDICGIEDGIKVKLILKLGHQRIKENYVEFVTKGMPIHDNDTNCLKKVKSLDSNLSYCLDATFGRNDAQNLLDLGERPVGKFAILLDIDDDAIVFKNKALSLKEINQRILDETSTDVVIVAGENQVEIKCHQCFLTVRSPVFQAMLQTPMREGLTKRIEIPDVSAQSVRILIQYMYTGDIFTNDIGLLVELLKLAHKYDVMDLEQKIRHILNEKPKIVYSVEVAVDLFCFVRNFDDDGSRKLKTKTSEVLESYVNQIKLLHGHGKLFKDDQVVASDLIEYLLNSKI